MGFLCCKSSKGATSPKPIAEKPVAEKPAADGTLLDNKSLAKPASEASLVQHCMMRIPVSQPSIDSILKLVQSPDMQKALNDLKGLLSIEISKGPEEDACPVIFMHTKWQDIQCMQASEAKLGDLLKPLNELFAGAPEAFSAAGGIVQLSGVSLWLFKPSPATGEAVPSAEEREVDEVKAVAEQEPEKVKVDDEVQDMEPAVKLMGAEEEQEIVIEGEQSLAKDKSNPPAARNWLLNPFGITCCAANK